MSQAIVHLLTHSEAAAGLLIGLLAGIGIGVWMSYQPDAAQVLRYGEAARQAALRLELRQQEHAPADWGTTQRIIAGISRRGVKVARPIPLEKLAAGGRR